jgi:hypothetical protein
MGSRANKSHATREPAVPANTACKVDRQHAVKLREGKEWRRRIVEIGLRTGWRDLAVLYLTGSATATPAPAMTDS